MVPVATVNPAAPAPAPPVEAAAPAKDDSPDATASHPEPDNDDNDSILSDPPQDETIPLGMQMDGVIEHADHPDHAEHPEHATDEPNPKKRKRYNDPYVPPLSRCSP